MEVRDLIERLKEFNEDAEVEIEPAWASGRAIRRIYKQAMRNVVTIEEVNDPNQDEE